MTLDAQLAAELDSMDKAGTRKMIPVLRSPQGPVVDIEGRGEVICLCSNDYLGLAADPVVVAAATDGLLRYGAGTASVRFICGKFEPHVELERDLAEFLHTPASLTYTSCWNANAALLDALCDVPAAIFSDRLNHASIIDGMRLARPAHKAVFEHSDMDDLRRVLSEAPATDRRLIVTDGVFSMEGDLARMDELAALAAEHDATLIVDDSHGIGVVGETGRGVMERFELLGREDIVLTGTLGKALGGAAGGFVAGSHALCDVLEQRSRAQLFSNGLPPSVACGARAAVAALRDDPSRLASASRERRPHASRYREDGARATRGRKRDRPDHRRCNVRRDSRQRDAPGPRCLRDRLRLSRGPGGHGPNPHPTLRGAGSRAARSRHRSDRSRRA